MGARYFYINKDCQGVVCLRKNKILTPSASTSSAPDPSTLSDDAFGISRLVVRSLKGISPLSASPSISFFVDVFCITMMEIQIQEISYFILVSLMLVLT